MNAPIRVLVVDDSAFMRKALTRQIESDRRFKVVDTACNGREGIDKTLLLKPDVVTLDVEMPILNGLEALKGIVAKCTVPVIMVSAVTQAGAKTTMEALEIGAIDFIPKARGTENIHDKLLAASQSKRRMRAPAVPVLALVGEGGARLRPQVPAGRANIATRRDAEILLIGSSTGGPQALQQVIRDLPASFRLPVVIAQHMPPQFTGALAKRLDETCALTVVEAKDGDPLTKGTVYVAPGGMQMRVTQNQVKVSADSAGNLYKPSVNILAESVLKTFGRSVVAVMLTGMGNDGTKEFVRLRQAGAHTIAQDQATSVVYGMPRSLVEADGADEVLPLDQIGVRLRSLAGN